MAFASSAQEGLPIIKTYSVENYQAGVENWDAVQDNCGVMYFANTEGILEFDGLNWRLIQTENNAKIRSLDKTEAGTIYVGGDSEIGRLDVDENGQKLYVSLVQNCPLPYRKYLNHVWKVIVKDGRKFFLASGMILVFNEKDEFVKSLDENIYLRSFFFIQGSLYAYSNSKGILVLDDHTLSFSSYSADPFLLNRSIEFIDGHPKSGLRIHIFDQGFFRIDHDQVRKEEGSYPSLIDTDYIFCNGKNQDYLLLGTTTNGLYALTKKDLDRKFHIRKNEGLNDNKIFSIYSDQDNNIWICHENGLSYIELNAPVRLLNESLGLNGTGYSSILMDSVLFVGTSHGLYAAPIGKDHDFYRFALFRLIRQPVYFLEKSQGKLLIGGLHELMEYDGMDLKVLSNGHHTKIHPFEHTQGDYLVSTGTGFIRLQPVSGKHRVVKVSGIENEIIDFALDSNGLVWFIDQDHKLFTARLNKELDSLTILSDSDKQPELKFFAISDFKNDILTGTNKGLVTYGKNKNSFLPVSGKGDLNHPVTWLYNQDNRDLWYEKSYYREGKLFYRIDIHSSDDDSYRVNSLNSVIYGNKAFSIGQFHQPELTIGTSLGFLLFNLNFNSDKLSEAEAYIRRIRIADAEDTSMVKGLWTGSMNTFHFPLNNEVTEVEFDCASNYFYSQGKVLYSYKLKGLDENWSEWTSESKARYTITRDGIYTFQVRATSNYSASSKVTSYIFVISKPWYKTFWWYSIEMGILILIMAVSVYYNRKGSSRISKASAFMLVLIILTVFEIGAELIQDWIDAQGVTIFALRIAINIVIALSISPIEIWIRKKLITNHFIS